MLADVLWGTFEKTGDLRHYLEYKDYKNIVVEMKDEGDRNEMNKTG